MDTKSGAEVEERGRFTLMTGWVSLLGRMSMAVLLFEAASGLFITFGPFGPSAQWSVLVHTLIGLATLLPVSWYYALHWQDYRRQQMSQTLLLGYVGVITLALCSLSGLILTWQGVFSAATPLFLRQVHLVTTFITLGTVLPHLIVLLPKLKPKGVEREALSYANMASAATLSGIGLIIVLPFLYGGIQYDNSFPEDYNFLYGKERPFAPSLAQTDTGGAFDARSLAGSKSCGTTGCHEQILKEWLPSAHRYASMDPLFQKVQEVMAEQNGPESTRYCGGCHDPISLFSGTKNIFAENLTGLIGFQEGISCLLCHVIKETDIKGNANYTASQPNDYLWQWETDGPGRVARDFLIRTYPGEHSKLNKSMFKDPGFCAACHKQFIDQEINKVGWVQLQNQYDNWASSHWNVKGNPEKTVECRECHMPLIDSQDPSSGDESDYNRSADDKKHRSHRFLAANTVVPRLIDLEGGEEHIALTEKWLKGEIEIPEIEEKWAKGPVVTLAINAPEKVKAGAKLPIQVVFKARKVGHEFPTGPLDIIQSWLELRVADDDGNVIYHSGRLNEKNFIEPGSFIFKAEPVDQYGNLIDRHNLWEMVGVRYKRALFPGFSDTVNFNIDCAASLLRPKAADGEKREAKKDKIRKEKVDLKAPSKPGRYHISAKLLYRKADQYLINYLLGEGSGLTAPIVELTRTETTVEVEP